MLLPDMVFWIASRAPKRLTLASLTYSPLNHFLHPMMFKNAGKGLF
jgi:hypothetical protein